MTAPTEDLPGRPAGRRLRAAPEGSTSGRVVAFVLLCVASVALAAGYAWWSTARRASSVQNVSLPPIGSLAELEPSLGGSGPASPNGESPPPPRATPRDGLPGARSSAAGPPEEGPAATAPPTQESDPGPATGGANPAPESGRALAALAPAPESGRAPAVLPAASGTGGRAATANAATEGVVAGRPDAGRDLLFRHTGLDESFGVASVERPGAAAPEGRRATPLRCDRVDFAGERGVCLTTDRFYATHSIMVFDGAFEPLHRLPLHGVPSRVRVAPDGRLAAVTVFVSGHSYLDEGFSTETSVIDTHTGERRIANLEELDVRRDGAPFRAVDFNFWGVTFAADSDRFYATLATGGAMYLVEGRVSTRRADVVLEGVECPSLSPDQTRIVFKKRVPRGLGFGWRLHVLDLRSREAVPLAELRSVDDQAEWLDDATILYSMPDRSAPTPMVTDVWRVPADGGGAPERFLKGASSPAVLR